MNNEAKVRRKTQSKILGTARIMSYEDIELARAERAEKDTAKEATGKRKRGRPRKALLPIFKVNQRHLEQCRPLPQ